MDSKNEVGKAIYQAVQEVKWLEITYCNREGKNTRFWFEISDIRPDKRIRGFMKNIFKYPEGAPVETSLDYDRILEAKALDFTKARALSSTWDKINENSKEYEWLNCARYRHNVLLYLKECRLLDCDPVQREWALIEGIDISLFRKNPVLTLSIPQQEEIAKRISKESACKGRNAVQNLCLNQLSLDRGSFKYIVAYREVSFDPGRGTLVLNPELRYNDDVRWIEGGDGMDDRDDKPTLSALLEAYFKEAKEDEISAVNKLKSSLVDEYGAKYSIDTRPEMMILQRVFQADYDSTFSTVQREFDQKTLPYSLRSFFGMSDRRGGRRGELSIVLFDEKADIAQMRAVYSAVKQPVTFVQGPPGTGKTKEVILNVVLSEFLNERTVLMTSQNNKPVDDIILDLKEKLLSAFPNKDVEFPFLRLGNQEKRIQSCDTILRFYQRAVPEKHVPMTGEEIQAVREENKRVNQRLVDALARDERHRELVEQAEAIAKYEEIALSMDSSEVEGSIQKRREEIFAELSQNPQPSDESVRTLFSPANRSERFLRYLFDRSVYASKRIKEKKFEQLVAICCTKDPDERAKAFKEWLSSDENLKALLSIFPIVFDTNLSCSSLGSGAPIFDTTVMDEAGQCNATDALLAIARGKRLLLVGDPKQLKPVIHLNPVTNASLMAKYAIPPTYDYLTHSILDMMRSNDRVSNYVLLAYHYRCGRKIINFPNQRYYGRKLIIDKLDHEGELTFFDCENQTSVAKNTAYEEAKAIVDYLERNDRKNTSVITPFVHQATLINHMLSERGIHEVEAVSIHKMQGGENDTVILSLAISPKTSKRTWEWIRSNRELINVALTRAKKHLILCADAKAVETFSQGKGDDIKELIEYMRSGGRKTVVPVADVTGESRYANQSEAERDFFATVSHYASCHPELFPERNAMTDNLFPADPEAKAMKGNFDLVLFDSKDARRRKPAIVFELDGGEHVGNFSAETRAVRKDELCKRHGVKVFHLSNADAKDYLTLSWIVEDWVSHQKRKNRSFQWGNKISF